MTKGHYQKRAQERSKYAMLRDLFGDLVDDIKTAFLSLDDKSFTALLNEYRQQYGEKAADYAERTRGQWKSGAVTLSGQTMERLLALVPPYLTEDTRLAIAVRLLRQANPATIARTVRLPINQPEAGWTLLQSAVSQVSGGEALAHLPSSVAAAMQWLVMNEPSAARALFARAERAVYQEQLDHVQAELDQLRQGVRAGKLHKSQYVLRFPFGLVTVLSIDSNAPKRPPVVATKQPKLTERSPVSNWRIWLEYAGWALVGLFLAGLVGWALTRSTM